jgi:hypothetical protein
MDEQRVQQLDEEMEPRLDLDPEEFSIVELEDRLEMVDVECCNNNCGCPPPP